jgi:hypothetical protein
LDTRTSEFMTDRGPSGVASSDTLSKDKYFQRVGEHTFHHGFILNKRPEDI